jgi:hypothetical protein
MCDQHGDEGLRGPLRETFTPQRAEKFHFVVFVGLICRRVPVIVAISRSPMMEFWSRILRWGNPGQQSQKDEGRPCCVCGELCCGRAALKSSCCDNNAALDVSGIALLPAVASCATAGGIVTLASAIRESTRPAKEEKEDENKFVNEKLCMCGPPPPSGTRLRASVLSTPASTSQSSPLFRLR